MPDLAVLILGILAVILAFGAYSALFQRVTVFEYQRGVRFRNGKLVGLVDPGRHRLYRPTTTISIVDMRETVLAVAGQEVVTADGISVKLSLSARYRIIDPIRVITAIDDARSALYAVLQVALREVVSPLPIDDVLQTRDSIGSQVLERSVEQATALGMELTSVDIKDLMFPGPLKKVFAQVIEARQQGLASLEKARGETAAMRSLANAARMVDDNPSLLQLRILQQFESSSGNTVVLGLPAGSGPLPIRERVVEEIESGPTEPSPDTDE
jgi:regulator of protease activity HflC (stomatin/prohibitin superfamily)